MNEKLKVMWDSVRGNKLPSHKEFRQLGGEESLENKTRLKSEPDYYSKERNHVRRF